MVNADFQIGNVTVKGRFDQLLSPTPLQRRTANISANQVVRRLFPYAGPRQTGRTCGAAQALIETSPHVTACSSRRKAYP